MIDFLTSKDVTFSYEISIFYYRGFSPPSPCSPPLPEMDREGIVHYNIVIGPEWANRF